jgi:hypothetical protein
MEVLQRWRRLDLAERWRAVKVSSARVFGGERCLERSWISLPTFYKQRLCNIPLFVNHLRLKFDTLFLIKLKTFIKICA